ncbi:hypothetical protein I5729_05330 [Acinetobacter bereziniae]|uniref:hypothetical protein n=1 Tax=Acinetobacter bereziniae TaxID=106648 RepID=UPI001900A41E|nr:hypothetical protein [Acinetobacter bereziniae]MBJ9948532.1 hypothetical protein [Acinetobacter bereziniae]
MRNLLEALHSVLAKNVLGDKQYESRYKGFIGELSFQEWLSNYRGSATVFTGGYLLPRISGNRSIEQPIYFTVSSDNPQKYIHIYSYLNRLSCESMYFINWNNECSFSEWHLSKEVLDGIELRVPNFNVFKFDPVNSNFISISLGEFLNLFPLKQYRTPSRAIPSLMTMTWQEKLSSYEYKHILDLYVQRLIFDGYIGYSREHGIPSDIDAIIYSEKLNTYALLEVKEKDKSKRPPQGFGMDVERIADLSKLKSSTGLPIYYIVREVDNQKDRNFLSWKIIELDNFKKNLSQSTIQGGSGMGFENGQYPTQICPYEHFKDLN